MKTLIVILPLIALMAGGCCSAGSEPGPPYGTPDDVQRFYGTNGYATIDYTYYCLGGEYVSVAYLRIDDCSDYEENYVYRSDGICSDY